MIENIEMKLSNIEKLLTFQKEVLNFDEVATYTGLSKSFLYKLTASGQISHYKPTGKMLFFNKKDVDAFLQQNRISTTTELDKKAVQYVTLKNVNTL